MKKSIKLNESQLYNIITESVKRVLKEGENINIIDSIPSDKLSDFGKYYPGLENSDEDFQQCYNDLDLYVENMTKEYSTETIISVLEKLLDFYKNA